VPPPPPPKGCHVKLFYNAHLKTPWFDEVIRSSRATADVGALNDNISSYSVQPVGGAHCSLELYEHTGFRGKKHAQANTGYFEYRELSHASGGFDDKMSSWVINIR
jgi:hypothetical protein